MIATNLYLKWKESNEKSELFTTATHQPNNGDGNVYRTSTNGHSESKDGSYHIKKTHGFRQADVNQEYLIGKPEAVLQSRTRSIDERYHTRRQIIQKSLINSCCDGNSYREKSYKAQERTK